ncbi:GATA transcription factor 4 [Platanthera zijinensis]|uniref:GATA transcription factor n=1 Tax=Platanthera zijinensis TaxID=2320716 RepID=A0AAP0BI39_9ASPA
MATKWEFECAAVGMGMPAEYIPAEAPAYVYGMPAVEKLRIEDLLDFTTHELGLLTSSSSSSAVSETTKLLTQPQLTDAAAAAASDVEYIYPCCASFPDIYMPRDEVAELEWLSKFVEDSFSDVPVQSPAAEAMLQSTISHRPNMPASCRGARSKRSRGVAAAAAAAAESSGMPWSSLASSSSTSSSSSSSSDFPALNVGIRKRQEGAETGTDGGATRRCTHCASEKTPQWRTGPFGPKTLCNACGVRYKSGRLVPEYRPAASPTFLLTQHSNSHRKVLELRRQKELHVRYNDNASSSSASTVLPEMLFLDYDVC